MGAERDRSESCDSGNLCSGVSSGRVSDRKEGERAEIHLGTDHGNVLYIDTIWGIYDHEKQPEYGIYGRCIGGSTLYRRRDAWRNAELRLS